MTLQEAKEVVELMVLPPSDEERYALNPSFVSLLNRFIQRNNPVPYFNNDDLEICVEVFCASNPREWIWTDTIRDKKLAAMRQGATEAEAEALANLVNDRFQIPLPRT